MCGIAGILRLDGPATLDDLRAVRRMTDAQASRGPDGSNVHQHGHVTLGHRRLSIIDLSDAGREPMPNEDGTVWVTYNGEIYNFEELRGELLASGHRFRSKTDGEVLVHGYEAWGPAGLLARLRGMFAFGLGDSRQGLLFLARDRLGIKPLYYCLPGRSERLAFASEVKALTASGVVADEWDRDALVGFLSLGSVPSPRTAVKGVHSLPPGHYLIVDRDGLAVRRYWELPDGERRDTAGLTAELRATLEDTVGRHLVSDVPLGVFLSGGVDSTGLVALASRRSHSRLHTLTVVFSEKELSEGEQARRTAEAYGTEHHEILVTSDDFVHELPGFFEAMDQPTNDGVNSYFICKAARKAGLTVVLSGAGGDEVFWGYSHYRSLAKRPGVLAAVLAAPGWLRGALVRGASVAGRVRGREQWVRLGYLGSRPASDGQYLALRGFFAPEQVCRLLGIGRAALDAVLDETFEPTRPPAGRDPIAAFNRVEIERYLHDQLLRDTDVFSMAHSIEARVPYLDHVVVEQLARVPARLKLDPRVNKPLLARTIGDAPVLAVARRRKMGFSFPLPEWVEKHGDALGETAAAAEAVDRREAGVLWREFRAGRLHWSRAWALVVLGAREARRARGTA